MKRPIAALLLGTAVLGLTGCTESETGSASTQKPRAVKLHGEEARGGRASSAGGLESLLAPMTVDDAGEEVQK